MEATKDFTSAQLETHTGAHRAHGPPVRSAADPGAPTRSVAVWRRGSARAGRRFGQRRSRGPGPAPSRGRGDRARRRHGDPPRWKGRQRGRRRRASGGGRRTARGGRRRRARPAAAHVPGALGGGPLGRPPRPRPPHGSGVYHSDAGRRELDPGLPGSQRGTASRRRRRGAPRRAADGGVDGDPPRDRRARSPRGREGGCPDGPQPLLGRGVGGCGTGRGRRPAGQRARGRVAARFRPG